MGFRLRRVRRATGGGLLLLLLAEGPTLAQEQSDDEGITVDEAPSGAEPEPAKPKPAREPGAKAETVVLRWKNQSIALPTDWVLTEDDEQDATVSWEIQVPGSEKRATLAIFDKEHGDPRSMPFVQAKWYREKHPDAKLEARKKPWPQLVATQPPDLGSRSPWVSWFHYRSIRNNLFTIRFTCGVEDFARSEQDMLAAVLSFTAEVELRPPIPKGYKTSEHGTWLLATAPGVTASTSTWARSRRRSRCSSSRSASAMSPCPP